MSTTTKKRLASILLAAIFLGGIIAAVLLFRAKPDFSYTVYEVENGWGYDISHEGKTIIHQPLIPALPGVNGFESEAEAEKVARLVIQKLENGESPGLSRQEVRQAIGRE